VEQDEEMKEKRLKEYKTVALNYYNFASQIFQYPLFFFFFLFFFLYCFFFVSVRSGVPTTVWASSFPPKIAPGFFFLFVCLFFCFVFVIKHNMYVLLNQNLLDG
jgi:hypothetical protein